MFTRTFTFSLSLLVTIVKVLGRAYKSRVLSFTDSTVSIDFDANELLKVALEDKNFDIYYHVVERNVQILELKENISKYTYYKKGVGKISYPLFFVRYCKPLSTVNRIVRTGVGVQGGYSDSVNSDEVNKD